MEEETAPVMPFGRYQGQSLDTVPSGYLRWLLRKGVSPRLEPWIRGELLARGRDPEDDED